MSSFKHHVRELETPERAIENNGYFCGDKMIGHDVSK
jgi:hypothetical protein